MKTEPTVGVGKFLAGLGLGVQALDHEKLVSDALDSFTKAEQSVQSAIQMIQTDIEVKEKEVAALQGKILGAAESQSKLTRVLGRIKAFTE